MAQIFRQASTVVAHLGVSEHGSALLPSIFQKIRKHHAHRQQQGRNDKNHFWDEVGMPLEDVGVWGPIRKFLERPWYVWAR
jgi:hypothetical protein